MIKDLISKFRGESQRTLTAEQMEAIEPLPTYFNADTIPEDLLQAGLRTGAIIPWKPLGDGMYANVQKLEVRGVPNKVKWKTIS